MFKFSILAFISLLFLPQNAGAQSSSGFFSGAYLLALCQSDKSGKEIVPNGHATCQSYIAGIIDYHKLLQSLSYAPSINFCVPNTASMKDLQGVVASYLKKNVSHSQFIAAPAVALALDEKYPCSKKKR